MSVPEIFVPLHQFDSSRIVFGSPTKKEFGEGKDKIVYYESPGFYRNDKGKNCKLYLEAPPQLVWGVSPMYPFGENPNTEQEKLAKLKGYQICYPMTSEDTIDNPTRDENYIISAFDSLRDGVVEEMAKECKIKKSNRRVPQLTAEKFNTASGDDDPSGAVKPIYDYPKKKDSDELNYKKPQRAFFKLLTTGRGPKLVCHTNIYGPGNKVMSPQTLSVKGERGIMHPVFVWEGIYWGYHGQNSPYGASVKIKLAEANYTPRVSRGPSRRMLGDNTAPLLEDDSDEDSSFPSPEENSFPEGTGKPLEETSEEETQDLEPPPVKTKKKGPRRKRVAKS